MRVKKPGPFVLTADDELAPVLLRLWADRYSTIHRKATKKQCARVDEVRALAISYDEWYMYGSKGAPWKQPSEWEDTDGALGT